MQDTLHPESQPLCPVCRHGHLQSATRVRVFHPHGTPIEVELLTSRCDICAEETTRAAQQRENLARLAARKTHYGGLLMGEEILALRKRYGLTQQQASQIFGKGKIAFSRYESETSYPDESTTLLLQLAIEKPDVIKTLADKARVELPLWKERCEDEQHIKIRPLPNLQVAAGSCSSRYTTPPQPMIPGSALKGLLRATILQTTRFQMTPFTMKTVLAGQDPSANEDAA